MRLATIVWDAAFTVALVLDDRLLPLEPDDPDLRSMRTIAGGGAAALARIRAWADRQPPGAWRHLDDVELGPAVPDPGAIYAIGLNYPSPDGTVPAGLDDSDSPRPLVYAKLPSSVGASGATLGWDRTVTANVDAEVELGVVIGAEARGVSRDEALEHVFGYTCVDDVSSRDPWLDGDQWLLGKSMPGFCPIGPWVVTPDELGAGPLRLGCTLNGQSIQDGSTSGMRFATAGLIAYLSRHVTLRPGDVIATGTPPRLPGPPGPDRHLEPGDVVSAWIEGIGEVVTRIA